MNSINLLPLELETLGFFMDGKPHMECLVSKDSNEIKGVVPYNILCDNEIIKIKPKIKTTFRVEVYVGKPLIFFNNNEFYHYIIKDIIYISDLYVKIIVKMCNFNLN